LKVIHYDWDVAATAATDIYMDVARSLGMGRIDRAPLYPATSASAQRERLK